MHQWSTIEIIILANYLIFFASGYITQITKIIKRKSAVDFDRWAFVRIGIGQVVFTIYGYTLKVPGYIIGGAITSVLVILLIILIIYFQRKNREAVKRKEIV